MDRSAVILAGGQGRRMGGVNKALLLVGGETIIERQLRAVEQWTDEVIIVSNDEGLRARLPQTSNLRIVPDSYKGEGPLAGLHAGLTAATRPIVWVVGCDQPFLDVASAVYLQERLINGSYQAALPLIGGRLQPLHALYRKEAGAVAEKLLQAGKRKFMALLDQIDWCEIEEREFTNEGLSLTFTEDIDTPEQHAKANFQLLNRHRYPREQ
ncbi:molybdenum cofactor guanylyltransferase [Cohnella mopanensis]|uniref:molybdenum cofactor guanylyltransferase n=1 Tax=Cohnella mopanensis TaxID=2911966 RepID=UPI001EF95009|nr:molybdenum cofactor guanylyltransferase [Cohnella mopanensis]